MPATSCGILMWRRDRDAIRVLLTHPGGPFWRNRDAGAWTIPKGARDEGESDEQTAAREFHEELGVPLQGALVSLGEIVQRGGKHVRAFAVEGDFDVTQVRSMTFDCEWPPHSGRVQAYPEVDRAEWFTLGEARDKLLESQCEFLDRLQARLTAGSPGTAPSA